MSEITEVVDDEVLNFHLTYAYTQSGEHTSTETASVKGIICNIDVDNLAVVIRSTITEKVVVITIDKENYKGGIGHLSGLFRILTVGDGMCAKGRPEFRSDGCASIKAIAILIERNAVGDEFTNTVNSKAKDFPVKVDSIVAFCLANMHLAPGNTDCGSVAKLVGIAEDVDTDRNVLLLRSFHTTIAVEVAMLLESTDFHGASVDDIEADDRITVVGTPGRSANGTYTLCASSVEIDFVARPGVTNVVAEGN